MYKLKVNIDKTFFMTIGEQGAEILVIDDDQVARVMKMKYLGVIIGDGLKFKERYRKVKKGKTRSDRYTRLRSIIMCC